MLNNNRQDKEGFNNNSIASEEKANLLEKPKIFLNEDYDQINIIDEIFDGALPEGENKLLRAFSDKSEANNLSFTNKNNERALILPHLDLKPDRNQEESSSLNEGNRFVSKDQFFTMEGHSQLMKDIHHYLSKGHSYKIALPLGTKPEGQTSGHVECCEIQIYNDEQGIKRIKPVIHNSDIFGQGDAVRNKLKSILENWFERFEVQKPENQCNQHTQRDVGCCGIITVENVLRVAKGEQPITQQEYDKQFDQVLEKFYKQLSEFYQIEDLSNLRNIFSRYLHETLGKTKDQFVSELRSKGKNNQELIETNEKGSVDAAEINRLVKQRADEFVINSDQINLDNLLGGIDIDLDNYADSKKLNLLMSNTIIGKELNDKLGEFDLLTHLTKFFLVKYNVNNKNYCEILEFNHFKDRFVFHGINSGVNESLEFKRQNFINHIKETFNNFSNFAYKKNIIDFGELDEKTAAIITAENLIRLYKREEKVSKTEYQKEFDQILKKHYQATLENNLNFTEEDKNNFKQELKSLLPRTNKITPDQFEAELANVRDKKIKMIPQNPMNNFVAIDTVKNLATLKCDPEVYDKNYFCYYSDIQDNDLTVKAPREDYKDDKIRDDLDKIIRFNIYATDSNFDKKNWYTFEENLKGFCTQELTPKFKHFLPVKVDRIAKNPDNQYSLQNHQSFNILEIIEDWTEKLQYSINNTSPVVKISNMITYYNIKIYDINRMNEEINNLIQNETCKAVSAKNNLPISQGVSSSNIEHTDNKTEALLCAENMSRVYKGENIVSKEEYKEQFYEILKSFYDKYIEHYEITSPTQKDDLKEELSELVPKTNNLSKEKFKNYLDTGELQRSSWRDLVRSQRSQENNQELDRTVCSIM